jgi:outer membrane protein TolC
LRLAEVRKSIAVAEYERAIQAAFREVADGLAGRATFARQSTAQGQVLAAAARRVDLSTLRYRAGLDGRLDLLDAQRSSYAARQAMLDLRRQELSSAAGLYRALGGGDGT